MFDYHVHSTFSGDCDTPIEATCQAAIATGVTEIAFTDHVDHEPADPGFGFYDYAGYVEPVAGARDQFGDRLTILAGAEVDFNTRIRDEVERFLDAHDFDFVIGSVHYGDAGEIIFPDYFETRSLDDVFLPYYSELHAAADTGWFDTLGHIDLPKRYRPELSDAYDPLRYRDALNAIFRTLIARGMSFEINTSGMRQTPATSMPGPQIVELYPRAGGRLVTIGSDSHVAATIGAGFVRTFTMLELTGINEVSRFRKRVREQVPISQLRP
ncbi:MAG TPA: histidinol-phosphatase HisJ family protein [Thermomicrobiales bacterium]|nr:histidinol-phosphatase HisJ family protein [Thermomicrobiales bacterium]